MLSVIGNTRRETSPRLKPWISCAENPKRDSIHQTRVGAARLPWVIVQKITNPNGVA
jgi:hypothetical protein